MCDSYSMTSSTLSRMARLLLSQPAEADSERMLLLPPPIAIGNGWPIEFVSMFL